MILSLILLVGSVCLCGIWVLAGVKPWHSSRWISSCRIELASLRLGQCPAALCRQIPPSLNFCCMSKQQRWQCSWHFSDKLTSFKPPSPLQYVPHLLLLSVLICSFLASKCCPGLRDWCKGPRLKYKCPKFGVVGNLGLRVCRSAGIPYLIRGSGTDAKPTSSCSGSLS